MANKLHYSPEALKDLDEIWDYISFDLCSVGAAGPNLLSHFRAGHLH